MRYCARLRDWVFALRKRVSLGFGRAPPAQIENRAQWTQLLSAQSTTIKAILNNHALPSVTYFDASTRKCPEPDAFNFANDETHNTVLIRCIERLAANGVANSSLLKYLTDLTSGRNTYGAISELLTYSWFLDQHVDFTAQIPATGAQILNPNGSDLDGLLSNC